MAQSTISCELHDFIEIACMYGYRVKLTLKEQQTIEGKALDIVTNADKREYLVVDTGQDKQKIELLRLDKMQTLTPNAVFKVVTF